MGFLTTAQNWLPHPVYRFCGGPADGKDIAVTLREAHNAMVPPDIWRVPGEMPNDPNGSYEVHSYRFVRARGEVNIGHYEWIKT